MTEPSPAELAYAAALLHLVAQDAISLRAAARRGNASDARARSMCLIADLLCARAGVALPLDPHRAQAEQRAERGDFVTASLMLDVLAARTPAAARLLRGVAQWLRAWTPTT